MCEKFTASNCKAGILHMFPHTAVLGHAEKFPAFSVSLLKRYIEVFKDLLESSSFRDWCFTIYCLGGGIKSVKYSCHSMPFNITLVQRSLT